VKSGELVQNIRVGVHREPRLKTRVVVDLTTELEVNYTQDFKVNTKLLTVTLTPVIKSSTASSNLIPNPTQEQDVASDPAVTGLTMEKTEEAATVPSSGTLSLPGTAASKNESGNGGDGYSLSDPLLVDVSFDDTSNKGEMVLFQLNDFYPPTVSAIEQGTPRIVCDFINMRMAKEVQSLIDAHGQLIDKIRVARHRDPVKVRVVLDLFPNRDYDLQQVFFKDDNLFVLIVNVLEDDIESTNE
jgi:hypothetical protein